MAAETSSLFAASSPVLQAFIATVGTYLLTVLGTLPVFFFRSAPRRLMDGMMGFAGGVMVAASCWSLLIPAIASGGVLAAAVGLLVGGTLFYVADQMLPHLHAEFPDEATEEGPHGKAISRCSSSWCCCLGSPFSRLAHRSRCSLGSSSRLPSGCDSGHGQRLDGESGIRRNSPQRAAASGH